MIGILTMADMQSRDGNSIRPNLEAEGLLANGFTDFMVFSPNPRNEAPYVQQRIRVRKHKDQPWPFFKLKLGVDLVHAQQLSGAMLKQKYIMDMHGFATKERENLKYGNPIKGLLFPMITTATEMRIIRNAERIVCASRSIMEDLQDHFKDRLDIEVVNNMVKPEYYKPTRQKGLVLGLIGSFANKWGIENLKMLQSMLEEGLDCPVRTVGGITEEQKMRFNRYPNVQHLGRVSDKEYMKFLQGISVLLLPFPPECGGGGSKNKLLEAAASSAAIVSTPVGAVGFDEKDRLLMGETPLELVKRVKELENSRLRAKLGSGLRAVIERSYNYKTETKKLIKIYAELG